MSRSLEEWIKFYNRKVSEPFKRDERYELFYSPEHGFCEIAVIDKMLIVQQLCGNLRYWRDIIERAARASNLKAIGTFCCRSILPYLKLGGFSIRGSEEVKEGRRYYCEDFNTGQLGQASPAWLMPNGKRAYFITWSVNYDDVRFTTI